MADGWYTHGPVPVYDARPGMADRVQQNGTGGKAVLVKDGSPLTIRDLNGTVLAPDAISSNADGQSIMFQVQARRCLVQFGDIVNPSWGAEVADELASQSQVLQAAQDAVAAAQQAVQTAQSAQTSAASAAAAAQAAATSAQAAAAGNTGGGLSTTALDDYLNGTGTASAAGLMMIIPGIRQRALVSGTRTGAWQARPNLPIVLNVGYSPAPSDAGDWDVDLTVPSS